MSNAKKALLGFVVSSAFGLRLSASANEPQIVIDPETLQIHIVTWDTTSTPLIQETQTGDNFNFADSFIGSTWWNTGNNINTPTIQINTTGLNEFEQALAWMHANGLTRYDNLQSYRPNDGLIREEAAKIIGEAYRKFWYPTTTRNENCSFTDASLFDPTLVTNIQDVCKWGMFQWSNGRFLPKEPMTKWQALAVIIRMLEGKKSEETGTFWRDIYHKKWLTIWITNDIVWGNFASAITREEIALFIWRAKEIVENEQLKIFSLNAMSQIDAQIDNTDGNQHLQSLALGIDLSNDPELQEAINWMYEHGFTIHQTVSTFNPFSIITREQAAKIINIFAWLYAGGEQTLLPLSSCTFSDLKDTPEDLIPHITQACRKWLVVWFGSEFKPKDTISKAYFIVALIRLLEGKQLDERVNPRWKNYFELARSLEIVWPGDVINFDNAITRYEVAIFLHRFKVKYLLLKNMNNSKLINDIITMIDGSIQTGVNWLPEWQVFFNTPALADINFTIGYIDIFGTRQKIVRTSRESFFSNNLVRYGDIFDMETDEKIGTITFIIGNGFLIEWNIRYTNWINDRIVTAIPWNQTVYAIRTVQRGTGFDINTSTGVVENSTWTMNTGTNNIETITGSVATETVQ
jgi:hypothetical protein